MFRNREIRQFALLFSIITIILTIIGFLISTAAGILAIISAAAFGTAFYLFTRTRYKNLARISDQIDRVLHHDDILDIGELEEGELSILHTEIRKMTLRIREQNEALKTEKQYLADSLADIAHQLRTPLTSVSLLLSLLANNPDETKRKTFIREAEEFLLRMDWLITSLLKLSRLDAGIVDFQTEQIIVNNLINASIRPFLIPMELHNIDIQTNIPQEITIQGDSTWLSEAMQNILKNCMESTGENGKIEIACQENPLFTEITIHDNGAGFENDDLPRLFERFYRGKNQNNTGYGIGLALSKMIITRQGGTITAENHPQGGAMFSIRFPK